MTETVTVMLQGSGEVKIDVESSIQDGILDECETTSEVLDSVRRTIADQTAMTTVNGGRALINGGKVTALVYSDN